MNTFKDFTDLLTEGTAAGAYTAEQQAQLEQLHHEYVTTVRAMQACLNSMDRACTLAKRAQLSNCA